MEKFSVAAGKFECPKDFKEVINTEGLCLEDIDDDSELFIIQAPADADFRKLHDQQLHLRGPTNFYYPREDGQQEVYMCTTTDADDSQLAKACLVLPERNSLKLRTAKKHIEGVIYIEKRAAFPQIGCPKELSGRTKEAKNFKKRASSLSSGGSTVLSDSYGKKGAPEDLAEELSGVSDLSSQSVTKKKKKKRPLSQNEGPSEDIPTKSESKNKQNKKDQVMHVRAETLSDGRQSDYSSGDADPQQLNSQISHGDINSKHLASTKKKNKHRGDETSHGIDESELSEKMGGPELCEDSPHKPHKKKHKTLDSSVTDPHSAGDSQEYRKHGKKHKTDKLKKSSHGDHSSSAYFSNLKIKEEIEDDTADSSSFYTEQLSEINSGELTTTSEKKSKKKKKKKSVNSDDQSSNADVPDNEIKEEINGDGIFEGNNSYADQLSDDAGRELSSTTEKKSKKKKKKDIWNNQSSTADISNYEIKKETEDHHHMVESGTSMDCLNGELPPGNKEKSKKKKKKKDKVPDEDYS